MRLPFPPLLTRGRVFLQLVQIALFSSATKPRWIPLKKESLLDLIINTTPVNQPVSHYLDLLALDGIYCRVGIPSAKDQAFDYNFIPLIFTQKKIVGSVVTGSKRTVEMLELTSKSL